MIKIVKIYKIYNAIHTWAICRDMNHRGGTVRCSCRLVVPILLMITKIIRTRDGGRNIVVLTVFFCWRKLGIDHNRVMAICGRWIHQKRTHRKHFSQHFLFSLNFTSEGEIYFLFNFFRFSQTLN